MSALAFAKLASDIQTCQACPLAGGRTQASTWRGTTKQGAVLFIGEAPGREEDRVGQPFVGPAGKLLQTWIDGPLGLGSADWLIGNAVACFPHDEDGKPAPPPLLSIQTCSPFLLRLIQLVQPRPIVALGRSAQRALEGLGIKDFLFIKHPAYYLRSGQPWAKDVELLAQQIRAVRP